MGMRFRYGAATFAFAMLMCANASLAQSAQGTFQNFSNPGGGHVLTGVLGREPSLQAAVAAVLRRIHAEFGNRPKVTQSAENPRGHSTALFFTESRNGQSYVGISLISAAPGAVASAAVLYDTTRRFASTLGPMLRRLDTITNPQGGTTTAAVAPAEPLQHRMFSDGTGSIDLPADWKLLNGGGGSASAEGPTGEIVTYNLTLSAMDPSNPTALNYLRGLPPQYRQSQLRRTALLAYTGDPLQAWNTAFRQLARQNDRPGPSFSVQKVTHMGAAQGLHLDELTGEGTIPGIPGKSDDAPGMFVAFVQVTPPNTMGQWSMYSTFVFVPKTDLYRQGATAAAILESVRINFGAVNAQSAAIRETFQKSFEAMLANSQAQNTALRNRTDQFLANQSAQQEGMHKWAVSMENFAGDRTTIVNTTTGMHGTVSSAYAGILVQPGSVYQTVPPSELLRGVDY